jgi:hypothetical protein
MEPLRVFRPMVADSYRYHFDAEQDSNPDQSQIRDPHRNEKSYPYKCDADPKHWSGSSLFLLYDADNV